MVDRSTTVCKLHRRCPANLPRHAAISGRRPTTQTSTSLASRARFAGAATTSSSLAPSARARDLQAGRRALQKGELRGVVMIAPALPLSTRSSMPIPVGVRANVAAALQRGDFDVVHGVDPVFPACRISLSSRPRRPPPRLPRPRAPGPPAAPEPPRSPARTHRYAHRAHRAHCRTVGREISRDLCDRAGGRRRPEAQHDATADDRRRDECQRHSRRPRGAADADRAAGWDAIVLRTARLAARPAIPLPLREAVHLRTDPRRAPPPGPTSFLARQRSWFPRSAARAGCASRLRASGAQSPSPRASQGSPSSQRPRSCGWPRTPRPASSKPPAPATRSTARRSTTSPLGSRSCTPRLRPAGDDDAPTPVTPSPTATGSSPISTCTPTGRATAQPTSMPCSTRLRASSSERSRSPITMCSAVRSKRSRRPGIAISS